MATHAKSKHVKGKLHKISHIVDDLNSTQSSLGFREYKEGRGGRPATVEIVVGRSDFHNLAEVLARTLNDLANAPPPAEVKMLNPATVTATPPKAIWKTGCVTSTAFRRSIFKYVKSVVGKEPWLRWWPRKHGGWIFVFTDRVLIITCTSGANWTHSLVPEEGIDPNERIGS